MENKLHKSSEITLAYFDMEMAIIKEKSILSFSKSPLVTFLYTSLVMLLIKFSKRVYKFLSSSAESMEALKIFSMYCKEYWYIESIKDRSFITKNRTDPLVETGAYSSLVFSTVYEISLLSYIFTLIYTEASCEFFRVSISSTSSKIVSAFAFCSSLKMFSSLSFNFFVY